MEKDLEALFENVNEHAQLIDRALGIRNVI